MNGPFQKHSQSWEYPVVVECGSGIGIWDDREGNTVVTAFLACATIATLAVALYFPLLSVEFAVAVPW